MSVGCCSVAQLYLLPQVRRALKTLGPEDTQESLRLNGIIDNCTAALALQPQYLRAKGVKLADIVSHVTTLADSGYQLPSDHQILITKLIAIDAAAMRDFQTWVTRIDLGPCHEVDWTLEAASFKYIKAVSLPEASEDFQEVVRCWHCAVFNNSFFAAVQKCCSEDDAPAKLTDMCALAAQCLSKSELCGKLPEWTVRVLIEPALKLLRGLLALLCPVPQYMGGKLNDVNYINPKMAHRPQ